MLVHWGSLGYDCERLCTGSNGNKGVRCGPFTGSGAGQAPVEIQGWGRSLDGLGFHLSSPGTPTPPFPLELLLPLDQSTKMSNSDQLLLMLDLKTYPLKIANRERALLLTYIYSTSISSLEWKSGKSRGGGCEEPAQRFYNDPEFKPGSCRPGGGWDLVP